MANNHSTLTGLFTDIADAIRAKGGGGSDTLTWDGNTDGLETVNNNFYKIDNAVLSSADITDGYTIYLFAEFNSGDNLTTDFTDYTTAAEEQGLFAVLGNDGSPLVISATSETFSALFGVEVSSGTYFIKTEEVCVSSISIANYTGFASKIIADNFPEAIAAIDTQEDLDPELSTQDDLITQLTTALEGKAGASGGGATSGVIFAGYVTATDSGTLIHESLKTCSNFVLTLFIDRTIHETLNMPSDTIISVVSISDMPTAWIATYANGITCNYPTNVTTEGLLRDGALINMSGTYNTSENAYILVTW